MTIKHTVLVITYNHEKYVHQAIDSLLQQTTKPYKIVILDDHSTDKTFEILSRYKIENPDLIDVYRNEKNLGIFENLHKLRQYAEGDMISMLAGDDYIINNRLFEELNSSIIKESLKPIEDKFILITNTAHLHRNGKITIWDNYKIRNKNIFKVRIRLGLSYRNIGYSIKLFKELPTEKDIIKNYSNLGIGPDFIKGIEEILRCDKFVFLNTLSSVYRLGVGITSREKSDSQRKSYLNNLDVLKKEYNAKLDKRDFDYLNFLMSALNYQLKPSIGGFIRAVYLLIYNFNNFTYNNPFILQLKHLVIGDLVFVKRNILPWILKIRSIFKKQH